LRTQEEGDTLDTVAPKGIIHTFTVNGTTLLADTATGSLLVLDSETAKITKLLEDGKSLESIPDSSAKSELQQLIKDGTILSPVEFPPPQTLSPKSVCLIVSHACNMACTYCSLAGVTGEDKLMRPETAVRAIDWITRVAPGRKIDVDFFGGEPLLAWDTVKAAVEAGERLSKERDKLIRWSLSTNCIALDQEKIDYCREHFISLILSLDGNEVTHDLYRKTKNGGGSFELASRNALEVTKNWDGGFYVRGTYSKKSINFSDSVKALHKMGFSSIAFEPVVSSDPEIGFITDDLPTIRVEYEKLAKYYVECKKSGNPFRFYHFELDLDEGPCAYKVAGGCGAGCEYVSISPDGTLWPCHQLDGNPRFGMGELRDTIPESGSEKQGDETLELDTGKLDVAGLQENYDKYTQINHISNKPDCISCWASTLCAGGCIASNQIIEGSFSKIYKIGCEIQKIRLEVALWVQAQLS